MEKVNITLTFEDEKLEALDFYAKKENSNVQKKLDEALRRLYEDTVPEAVREYLDGKAASAAKPKRPAKPSAPKAQAEKPDAAAGGTPRGSNAPALSH